MKRLLSWVRPIIINAVPVGVAVWIAWTMLVPVTSYVEIFHIHINDATEGEMPRILFDRAIHRDLEGEWVITVFQAEGGSFSVLCVDRHNAHFYPGATLKDTLTLRWWVRQSNCPEIANLAPGSYYVQSRLEWSAGGLARTDSWDSNVFKIMPK